MKWLYSFIVRTILHSPIWAFFILHVLWRVRLSNYYTKSSGTCYEDARGILKKGDVVLSSDRAKPASALQGIVGHAAFFRCLVSVAEMVHSGWRSVSLYDFFKESDRVIVMRCDAVSNDASYAEEFAKTVWSFDGRKYDPSIGFGVEALYCSEMLYHGDFEKRIKVNIQDLAGIGQEYVSPLAYLYSENSYCVYDSAGELTGMTGHAIKWYLTKRL